MHVNNLCDEIYFAFVLNLGYSRESTCCNEVILSFLEFIQIKNMQFIIADALLKLNMQKTYFIMEWLRLNSIHK